MLSDFLILLGAQNIANWVRFDYLESDINENSVILTLFNIDIYTNLVGFVAILLWIVLLISSGGYKFNTINGGTTWYKICFNSSLISLAVLALFSYFTRLQYSRVLFILFIPVGFICISAWHIFVRTFIRTMRIKTNFFEKRAILVGSDNAIKEFEKKLVRSNEIGIVSIKTYAAKFENIHEIVNKSSNCDSIIILGSASGDAEFVRQMRWAIEGRNIELVLDSNLTTIAGRRLHISALHNLPLIHIDVRQNVGWRFFIKRIFDIIFSMFILTICIIPFIFIAFAIKIDSKGPVFYKQKRIGKNHKEFKIYKFRSMRFGADAELASLLAKEGKKIEALYKIDNDPRITKVGNFLRKTSLDEFPQFFNTLIGNMSIVGPRPQIIEEIEVNSAKYNRRLVVKPGISGPWQISGRNSLSLEESVDLDLDYIENWTLWGDLIIIIKTIKEVIHSKTAK